MNIDDILASRGKKKDGKKGHHLFKSTFNVDKNKSGKNSKNKLDTNDPNFWEKCGIPFDGYNAKQLLKKFRGQKNAICDTHAT